MPSPVSTKYLAKINDWMTAKGEVSLDRVGMSLPQQYRARLALDAFHLWQRTPLAHPRQLLTRLAARDYEHLLKEAELGNEKARMYVEALKICRGEDGRISARSYNEITNDVQVLDWFVGQFSTPNKHIHRAIYEDNARWLATVGRKTGNISAVREAQRNLEVLNNKFQENEDPQDQMAKTDINITGDVSIVKKGRENLSDEENEKLRKKYGLTEQEYATEMEEINGVYQEVSDEEDDIFIRNENTEG